MRYGITIPNFGATYDPCLLATWAREAEDAGWDGFFLWDHVMFGSLPTADPWITLTAIALNTERILLGPLVTPLPRRRPAKLARETVTLDHLSNGRLILGVGIGVGALEWEQLGEPADLKIRGAMLDEGLDVLTKMWRGEPFSHQGTYYTAAVKEWGADDPALFLPRPVQQPRIPIWVAGMWPNHPPFRRAARWDGVFPINKNGSLAAPTMALQSVRDLTNFTRAARTTAEPFEVVISGITTATTTVNGQAVAAYAEAGATWWLEDISPWARGWTWQGPWPIERMHERILQGPPRG